MKRRSTKTAVSQGMRALLLLLALLLAFTGCNTTEPPIETSPSEESSTGKEETTTAEETTDTEEETTEEETTTEEESTTMDPLQAEFTDNEVVIVTKSFAWNKEYTIEDFAEVGCIEIRALDDGIMKPNRKRPFVLTLAEHSKQGVLDAVDLLRQREDISSASPNYTVKLLVAEPSSGIVATDGWERDRIDLPEAWELETGSDTVKVGVIDSAIDASHPRIEGNVNEAFSKSFVADALPDWKIT